MIRDWFVFKIAIKKKCHRSVSATIKSPVWAFVASSGKKSYCKLMKISFSCVAFVCMFNWRSCQHIHATAILWGFEGPLSGGNTVELFAFSSCGGSWKNATMCCRYGSQRQNKPVQGAGTGRKGQLEASCCTTIKIFRALSLFFNLLTS